MWRRVKESNHRPFGRAGFRNRLRATAPHPPWSSRQELNLRAPASETGALSTELRDGYGAFASRDDAPTMAPCTGIEPVSPHRQCGRLARCVAGHELVRAVRLERTLYGFSNRSLCHWGTRAWQTRWDSNPRRLAPTA
jgi:hypothetical protein